MTKDEALRMALEALDICYGQQTIAAVKRANAITALRQAIEQAEQAQPVALETVYETIIHWDEGGGKRSRRELARRIVDLYDAPPQRQPLTDEEILAIARNHYNPYQRAEISFSRAIEAAHGIKENT